MICVPLVKNLLNFLITQKQQAQLINCYYYYFTGIFVANIRIAEMATLIGYGCCNVVITSYGPLEHCAPRGVIRSD